MAATTQHLQEQLDFQTRLNQISAAIHSASSVQEIVLSTTDKIAQLLGCQRLTIYAIDSRSNQLYSIFRMGKEGPKTIRVPKDPNSLAGFCAVAKKTLNIKDVHDQAELAAVHKSLRFDERWDKAMGFTTKQVLAIPLVFERYLLGVLQLVNKTNGGPFSAVDETAAEEIARTLAIAFYNQRRAKRASPGKRGKFFDLVDKGLISEKALEEAVTYARVNTRDLGFVLMENHQIPKEEVAASLSDFYNCEFFFYDGTQQIPEHLVQRVRYDFWRKLVCAPISREGRNLKVAVVDPYDLNKVDVIKSTAIAPDVEVVVALEQDILSYLQSSYGTEESADAPADELAEILTELEAEGGVGEMEQQEDEEEVETEEVQGAVVRLANKIITDAYKQGASDIHIEPYGTTDSCVIRFRRDGECFRYQPIPASHRNALVSRLKIMAQLDISERRKPQDGKIRFRLPDRRLIELRVAVVPTAGSNEDVVMRILAASEPIPLDKLGMSPGNFARFDKVVREPYGLILCVGPTGSGKTTTLHSALGSINTDKIKIWTAEDPVEITQKGLRQVQVQAKIGFTFAAAMRAFLRADPDVIMIGEMRDEETASIGIEASLTGHLVFSTLHTNSAPETITRLLDMGLDPFNFSDALLAVLAQRLVRTLCKNCKEPYHPDEMEFAALRDAYGAEQFDNHLGISYTPELTLNRPVGCKRCSDTGYRGRMGLHELLLGSDPIKKLILTRQPVKEIRDAAVADGMTTLLQDGVWKVLEGETDFKQVRSVCIR